MTLVNVLRKFNMSIKNTEFDADSKIVEVVLKNVLKLYRKICVRTSKIFPVLAYTLSYFCLKTSHFLQTLKTYGTGMRKKRNILKHVAESKK
jgi:hypothetical protein